MTETAVSEWETCLPQPGEPRKDYHARLTPSTVAEIDQFRRENRWKMPYLVATRSLFVETACKFLLKTLKTGPNGA